MNSPRPPATPVTWTLVGVCLIVYLAELVVPGFIDLMALTPRLGASEPWRFATSAFAHSLSPTHIAFNMLALWMIGRGMETYLGRGRFLTVYLVGALAGGAAFVLTALPPAPSRPLGWNWDVGLVGASGAVFALFGALLVVQRRLRQDTRNLWILLAINAALVFVIPDIAWQAHVGGFAAGVLTAWLLLKRRSGLWVSLVVAGLIGALIMKYLLVAGRL